MWAIASLLLILAAHSVSTTPLSHRGYGNVRCKDKDGTFYNVGTNFIRQRDNYICNCTVDYENLRTRLSCASSAYRLFSTSSNRNNGYTEHARSEHSRSLAADHCQLNGQLYNLNTRWTMEHNGLTVSCTCNATAYLRCHRSFNTHSTVTYQPQTRTVDRMCLDGLFVAGEEFAALQTGGFYSLCQCGNFHSSTCKVLTVSGQECKFPFEESGRLYSTCTFHRLNRVPYCATSAIHSQQLEISNCITSKEELNTYYGYVFTERGNANGARCHFPFLFRGVEYYDCITTGRQAPWCATTHDYDRDNRYGYCQGVRSANSVYNRIGESVTLDCQIDGTSHNPIIEWYKLTNSGRRLIYSYDTSTGRGILGPSAGNLARRLAVVNSTKLIISDMNREDAGTFECNVANHHSGSSNQITKVSVRPNPAPTELQYRYVPSRNEATFSWKTNTTHDSVRLEIQKNGSTRLRKIRLPGRQQSYTTQDLRRGVNYEIRVFTVSNGQDSSPAIITYIGPRFRETNRHPQALVSDNEISLDWGHRFYPNIDATGWLVQYEDVESGEIESFELPTDATSHSTRNLTPGRRYRVTLYALLGNNTVQIASDEVVTEYSPIEIPSTPNIALTSPNTATISWSSPLEPVDQYEILYRDRDANSQWRSGTTSQPYVTLQGLIPGRQYDVRITPISGRRRGTATDLIVSTEERQRGGVIPPPRNLRMSQVTRSSFLASWNPPEDVQQPTYQISYESYPRKPRDNPIVRTTSQTRFKAIGLEGGRTYLFKVSTLKDGEQSVVATTMVTTVNEVCLVDGLWHGDGDLFFKQNRLGYMQNCTCFRSRSGGQWQCDPMICRGNPAHQSWTHVDETGTYMKTCSCRSGSLDCFYAGPLASNQKYYGGSEAILDCPHEDTQMSHTLHWYKVDGRSKIPIYTFMPPSREYEESGAGDLSSRLSLRNHKDLVIDNLQPADAGVYECHLMYDDVEPTIYYSNISMIPSTSEATQVTHNSIELDWPDVQDVSYYIVEYEDLSNGGETQTISVDRPHVSLVQLLPSTQYRITVIPVTGTHRGTPVKDVLVNTAAPLVNIRPPSNLRFDARGRTSVRILWNAPYRTNGEVYRVEYLLSDSSEEPMVVETPNRYLQIQNLTPGSTYQFHVYAELNGARSIPASATVTTKRIGNILVQASNDRRFHRVGESARLSCRYDQTTPGDHNIKWMRNDQDGGFYLIALYNTSTSQLNELNDEYRGRILSPQSSQLVINNLRPSDSANYKCIVKFATGGGSGTTSLTVVGPPDQVMFTSPNMSADTSEYLLSWSMRKLPRPDRFYLTVRQRGSQRSYKFQMPGNARSFLFRNLKPDRTYEGNIISSNRFGNSSKVDFYFSTPSLHALAPPTRINLIHSSPREVSFNVVGPRENVQFYKVSYKPEGASDADLEILEGNNANAPITLSLLTPNTPYIINVVATNGNRRSPALITSITTPEEVPDVPVVLSKLEAAREVVLNMSQVDDVDFYEVSYKAIGDGNPTMSQRSTGDVVRMELEPDTQYQVNVVAVNNAGQSSPLRMFVRTPPEETPPPRPTHFTSILPTSTSASIEWAGPLTNVQYYIVEYQSDEDIIPTVLNTIGPEQSMTIQDLFPNTKYRVSVKAVGQGGHSPFLVDYFDTLPATPIKLTVVRDQPNQLTLSRGDADHSVDYYILQYQRDNSDEVLERRFTDDEVHLDNLTPGSRYRVTLIAVNDGVPSTLAETYVSTPNQPAPVESPQPVVTMLEKSPTEVMIRINDTETNPDYYILQYQPESGGQVLERRFTDDEVHLDNLTPGSRYRVTLIAVNDGVPSTLAETYVSTPNQPEPVQPTAPHRIRVNPESPYEVILQVDGPSDHITRYHVTYSPIDQPHDKVSYFTTDADNEISLNRLQPSTAYRVAVSSVYNSVKSNPRTVTFTTLPLPTEPTPPPLSSTLVVTPPSPIHPPTHLRVDHRGFSTADLAWRSPASYIDGYYIEYDSTFTQHGEPKVQNLDASSTSTTLTKLIPGTEYQAQVFSKRGTQQSLPSTVTFMTQLDSPSNVHVRPSDDELIILWQNPEGPRTGTRFRYRKVNGNWENRFLSPDTVSYAIPLGDYRESYEVSLTAIGRTIESLPRTVTVHSRRSQRHGKGRIEVNDIEDSSAILAFHVTSLDGFHVTLQANGTEPQTIDLQPSVTFYQLENLKPTTHYTVLVDNGDQTEQIDSAEFVTKADRVVDFHADQINSDSFRLNWIQPAGTINGYVLQYRVASEDGNDNWNDVRLSRSETGRVIHNLSPSTLYDVTLTPTYANRVKHRYTEPGISSTIQVTTTPLHNAAESLKAPKDIQFSHVTHDSATAHWTPSTDNIDAYRVILKDENSSVVVAGNLRNSFAIFRDLSPYKVYTLYVYAVVHDVLSPPASATVYTGINQPERVSITNVGDSSFDVTWLAEEPNNPLLTGYEVSVNELDSSTEAQTSIFPANINQALIEDLQPGTIYELQVKSILEQMETNPIKKKVTTLIPAPKNLNFGQTSSNSFGVRWRQPSAHIHHYLVEYRPVGSPDKIKVGVENKTQMYLEDLQQNTKYLVSVYSVHNHRLGLPAHGNHRTHESAPVREVAEPSGLNVDEVTTSSFRINWQPQPGFSYSVKLTHPIDGVVFREILSPPTSSVVARDLLPGVLYEVELGTIIPSTPNLRTEHLYQNTKPEQPQNLAANPNSNNIVLTWRGVDFSPNEQHSSGYRLKYKAGDESVYHTLDLSSAQRSYTIPNLNPQTTYSIQLSAHVNNTLSEPVSITARTQPVHTRTGSEPNISSQKLGFGNYSVGWRSVQGPVQYYRVIYVRRSGGNTTQISVPGRVNEILLNNLNPAEVYDVTITAVLPNQEIVVGNVEISTSAESQPTEDSSRSAWIEWEQHPFMFTSYRITAIPVTGGQTHRWDVGAGESTARLSDLEPGTLYNILVEGFTNGQYVTVADIQRRTDIDPPSNLRIIKSNTNVIGLHWNPPKSNITGYSLTYQLDGRGTETAYIPPPRSTDVRKTLRRLQPGQRYFIRLYSRFGDVESLPAQVWAETLVPAPQRFRITQATPNMITLSWVKPVDIVTHYTLRVIGPNGFDVLQNLRLGPDTNTFTVHRLQPGTRYHITLAAWIGSLSSKPEYKSKVTPLTVPVVKSSGEPTGEGFLLQWKGKSRSVDGFKIVVEPQDGSAEFETTVDRFTKRYQIENLLNNVEYIVKIFPVSGRIVGEPSIVRIPAHRYSTTSWRLQVTHLNANSVRIIWNNPWPDVTEYILEYLLVNENDFYHLVERQPMVGDNSATINSLQSGKTYTIKLTAVRDSGGESIRNTLLLNVTTLIPTISNIRLHHLNNDMSMVTFSWEAPPMPVSSFVIKYREIDSITQHDYITIEVPGTNTTVNIPDMNPGKSYEFQFYSKLGNLRSDVVKVTAEIPFRQTPERHCQDPDTHEIFAIGQHWISKAGEFLLNCTCHGPSTFDCNTGEWCHTDNGVFNVSDTWRQVNDENNKKEECVCNGRTGYTCFPRNCQDGDNWFDEGEPWISAIDGYICNCICPSDLHAPCRTTCRPQTTNQNVNLEEE